jgi:hypothetical protein
MESTPEVIPHDPNPLRFEAGWQDYRRRSKLFWITLLSWAFIGYFFQPTGIPAAIWMALFVLAIFCHASWRCPQCGKDFFCSATFKSGFTRKCLNCGLRKWEGSSFDNDRTLLS